MKPFAYICTWNDKDGNNQLWCQYHDDNDPLPDSWDDNPTTIIALFTEDQLKEVAKYERERCAMACHLYAVDQRRNSLGTAAAFELSKQIRALGDE